MRVPTLLLSAAACAVFALAQTPAAIGPAGDAARGKALYEGKGNCASCHRIKGVGARTGPDLSEVGTRTPAQLSTKLTNPDAEILPANRPYRVALKNGSTVNGRLLNIDTFTIQMIDDKENLRSFVKSDLREYNFVAKSPMPSYQSKLTDQEIADVVAYLETLRAPGGRGGRGGGGGGGGAGAPTTPPAAGAARGPAPVEEPH